LFEWNIPSSNMHSRNLLLEQLDNVQMPFLPTREVFDIKESLLLHFLQRWYASTGVLCFRHMRSSQDTIKIRLVRHTATSAQLGSTRTRTAAHCAPNAAQENTRVPTPALTVPAAGLSQLSPPNTLPRAIY
jgi:hypothetical protein